MIIIGAEGVWAYQAINKQNQNQPTATSTSTSVAQTGNSNTISLTSPKTQFKIGEVVPIGINIDSNKMTAGADLIIHYDANLLSLASNASKTPVSLGNLYDEYPINSVDEKNGVITVSGITNKVGGVVPKGLFGTIIFQAKAAGKAKIFLEFAPKRTNDTNLIDSKTSDDVLEEVKNLDITITQ
ncbi:MAG: cohesin domain-containing protein [Microgenomates group bacterium]